MKEIYKKMSEVRDKLNQHKGQFIKISSETKFPVSWLRSFGRGTAKNINIERVAGLDEYFTKQEEKERFACIRTNSTPS